MWKLILILVIVTLGILVISIQGFNLFDEVKEIFEKPQVKGGSVYLGPIQKGYDEEHFRKTGISRRLEDGSN